MTNKRYPIYAAHVQAEYDGHCRASLVWSFVPLVSESIEVSEGTGRGRLACFGSGDRIPFGIIEVAWPSMLYAGLDRLFVDTLPSYMTAYELLVAAVNGEPGFSFILPTAEPTTNSTPNRTTEEMLHNVLTD